MKPRKIQMEDVEFHHGRLRTFKCPPGWDDCDDIDVLQQEHKLMIPWELDEADRTTLENGGTLWLHIYGGGMPPVDITAAYEPADRARNSAP
jgi:hypothetical protein